MAGDVWPSGPGSFMSPSARRRSQARALPGAPSCPSLWDTTETGRDDERSTNHRRAPARVAARRTWAHVRVLGVLVFLDLRHFRRRCLGGRARLYLHARGGLDLAEDVEKLHFLVLEVLSRVEIFHVAHGHVQPVVGAVVLKIIIVRQRIFDVGPQQNCGLVRPHPRHVAKRVAASAEHQHRDPEALHVRHAVGVTCHSRSRGFTAEQFEQRASGSGAHLGARG